MSVSVCEGPRPAADEQGTSANETQSPALPGPPVERVSREGALPASLGQQRLWFIEQLFPGSPTYNESFLVKMKGPVDAALLAQGLTEITRRHETWRTVFTPVDGLPMQQIHANRPFRLPVVDVTNLPREQREVEALRLAANDARRPFDLRNGPLVRALLIRMTEVDAWLIFTGHHIVTDGVSFFHVLVPELHALYVAFSRGEPSPLEDLPIQYADYAAWQRRWLNEEQLSPKLTYWREHLNGLTEQGLPTDYPRPSQLSDQGAGIEVKISAELVGKLRELGRHAGVTLFTTLLAAWKTLLFRYSGQTDVVVGSASAGRSRPEFADLLGFFTNNLVLRTQLDGSLTFLQLLARVNEVLQAAREHQDVPFDRLLSELRVERSLNKSPLYNNVFNLMPRVSPPSEPPEWIPGRINIGTAKVDLYLELERRPSGLVGRLEYQTELFSAATVERMVGHFHTLLESIVSDPEQRLADLPLLTAAETRQLGIFQGPVAAPCPENTVLSLEQLFEAQVARTPSAIAVEYGEERLSYQDLNRRANRLAHYLRAQGVGPDCLVGLCVERSPLAMIAILGVLKAGGAYVPLDPNYPSDRLQFMVEDSNIRWLITNRKSLDAVPHGGRTVLLLDEEGSEIEQQSTENPEPLAAANHLAYVIYTSGSTGRPKGVLVERRGVYYVAKEQESTFGIRLGTRVLAFFSLNFDVSVWELAMTWNVGGTLVLADPAGILPGRSLAEFLRTEDIHVVTLTPSALMVTPYQELPALHTLITAGEALPKELVDRWAPGRRFFNAYGPTETTIVSVLAECRPGEDKPPIGRPLAHAPVYILDGAMRRVPVGVPGELYIGGPVVARGYLNRPELTASVFVNNPFSDRAGSVLYKTGDRVKWLADGNIDYLGRTDRQIKLRGFRIELGEIETELNRHPAVQVSAVEVSNVSGDERLVAYVVPSMSLSDDFAGVLKEHLRVRLPDPMIPAAFVTLDRMPVTPSGKLDRARLPAPPAPMRSVAPPATSLEQAVAAVWQEVLGLDEIDITAPFFDVGGHSLALARVQAKLSEHIGADLDMMTLMRLPTIRMLAEHIASLPSRKGAFRPVEQTRSVEQQVPSLPHADAVAIVGMAIRAPGVRTAQALWDVVREGRETIRALDTEAMIAQGADPHRVRHPDFIPAEGVLDDADKFDAAFFGYSDADAALMDPQQRVFLECAYEALEHAACDPARYPGRIGVFGGSGAPLYWFGPVTDALRASSNDLEQFRVRTLNAPDFLATRVAFKLGLRGPAVAVQTACSTSLAAIHLARQSILAGECDIALAGGVSIASLTDADRGYMRAEGGIESADGHCRPFDASANGIVKASGVAIVVMKRLSSALADGDTIHAVMLGSAMNNDGANKLGFTAPSEDGIADAIQRAYETSGVDPESVQFVEAHGTGTRLGDPTEVRALTRAYRQWTDKRGFCALGSLKANLGHTDATAGVAGLIKAALTLAHGIIPTIPGFRAPNPLLDLPSTPFFVNDTPLQWPATPSPRRAGVNAMGIGGTNVHVVLEEAPPIEALATNRPFHLLCLSARTQTALSEVARRLGEHIASTPSLDIADVAHTLAVGRTQQRSRATVVCRDGSQAQAALASQASSAHLAASAISKTARSVVFLFPGHGVQYLKMGLELYETEPLYRGEIERCLEILHDELGLDLRPLLFGEAPEGESLLDEMRWVQPLLFTIEFALARQLMEWGVRPAAMLGHSLGEYVAACIAGVLSLRDALALVATRSRLADMTPAGRMLVVFADEQTITPYLTPGLAIATYAPGAVVLSGLVDEVEVGRVRIMAAGIETSHVRCARAAHSQVMRTIRDAFRRRVAEVDLRPPTIPIVSNVTGTYLTASQATSPDYWADHLCSPVRLDDGLATLLELEAPICIEIGPGASLGSFLKRHPQHDSEKVDTVMTLPDFRRREEPCATTLRAVGRVWELGIEVDWQAFYAQDKRRRIPLPTYPFEGKRYMLGAPKADDTALDTRALEIARDLGVRAIGDYTGLRSRLHGLCESLVVEFFARRLGHSAPRPQSIEALRESSGILPKFAPMFEKLVQILLGAGFAEHTTTGEIVLRLERQAERSSELSARLTQDYPTFIGLVRFIEHCVGHFDEALTGSAEPIGVLYPDGTDSFYQACMRETAAYLYSEVYLAMARDAVLALVGQRAGRTTRILEVGAGHGMLTWPLVERLRDADVDYHFTDIGRSYLQRAEAEAEQQGLAFMKTRRFDLNQAPEAQGIHDRYDVILGYNAVHVALDLPAALGNLHNLLVPGGSLILVELTRIEMWDHLTWGLAPGYWDVARMRGALSMDLTRWEDLLPRAGFAPVRAVPQATTRRSMEDHGLLIARRGLATERTEPLEQTRPTALATPRQTPPNDHQDSDVVPLRLRDVAAQLAVPTAAAEIVAGLWKRLLGVSDVPSGKSFFDLGGDSLLAVQFLAELRVKTGHELKMPQFVAQPTVDGIAACLRAHAEPARESIRQVAPRTTMVPAQTPSATTVFVEPAPSAPAGGWSSAAACLLPLRPTGTKRPFFCVHPIGGGGLCYANLVSALDPDRPFWGIQSRMLEDRSAAPASIEKMAADYVDAIQHVQPIGPYLLGGWSFGGVVATEMARELERRGEAVAQLVLIDVSAPSTTMKVLRRLDDRLPALAMLPAIFAEPGRINSGEAKRGDDISRLSDKLAMAARNLAVYDHHVTLWQRYAPAALDVPTAHFVARKRPLFGALVRSVRPARLPIREISTMRVSGDHFSMLSGDHVKALAKRIEQVLDAADGRGGTRGGEGSSRPQDEESVREFLGQIVDRMLARDGNALVEALWTKDDACALIALNGRAITGASPIKEHYTRSYAALRNAHLHLSNERVVLLAGGHVACVTAQIDSDLTYRTGDRQRSYRNVRVSWVLEKQCDGWRVIHAHHSLPIGEADAAIIPEGKQVATVSSTAVRDTACGKRVA